MGTEEPGVVGRGQLLVDKGSHVEVEVQRTDAVTDDRKRLRREVFGRHRSVSGHGVAELGVIRHTAARADVEHRFEAAGLIVKIAVRAFGEDPTPALAKQHH